MIKENTSIWIFKWNLDSGIGIDPHGIGIEDIILCWNRNWNLTTVSGIGIGIGIEGAESSHL